MKRLLSLAVSTAILLILYSRIDVDRLIAVFQDCNLLWMGISLAMAVPITFFSGMRLQQVVPPQASLGLWQANKLILAASVLNMVLPSKMGDIAKAYFMRDRGNISGTLSLSIVIFEKACDLLSLLLWCGFGLLLYPVRDAFFVGMTVAIVGGFCTGLLILGSRRVAKLFFAVVRTLTRKIKLGKLAQKLQDLEASWGEMQDYFWGDRRQLIITSLTSVFLWFLHLLQIWFFILALNAWVNPLVNAALSPLALLAGLLPLTFAGVGTRDAALIFLYQPYFNAATGAALGLLTTSRYLLPAIWGLPFLNQYLGQLQRSKREVADPLTQSKKLPKKN